jgi:hypothetical protein
MKKLLPILFLLSTIYYLLSTPAMAASSATMALSPASGSFSVGTPFSVGVYLNTNGAKVDGVDIKLNYEPAKLEAQQITPETTVFPDFPTKTINATNGKITISATAAVGSPYSNTTPTKVATINFNPLVSGTTTVQFDFTVGATTDSNVVENQTNLDILTSVTNGTYTLTTTPTGTPPPAADLTPTLFLLASAILFLVIGFLTLKSLKTSPA